MDQRSNQTARRRRSRSPTSRPAAGLPGNSRSWRARHCRKRPKRRRKTWAAWATSAMAPARADKCVSTVPQQNAVHAKIGDIKEAASSSLANSAFSRSPCPSVAEPAQTASVRDQSSAVAVTANLSPRKLTSLTGDYSAPFSMHSNKVLRIRSSRLRNVCGSTLNWVARSLKLSRHP